MNEAMGEAEEDIKDAEVNNQRENKSYGIY